MHRIFLFAICFAAVAANSFFQTTWELWKSEHGKSYSYEEENKRQYIWEKNLKKVVEHNMEADNGIHTFRLGMNQFADMDEDEWRSLVLSHVTRPANQMSYCNMTYEMSDPRADDTVDWRTKGYVTPVKNQLKCGSCWAFSTTGSVEGQHFKKTGKLVSLSEQNLMDCSTPEGDHSCHGGLMDFGFKYIVMNGGIDTEESYPYMAKDEAMCKFNKMNIGATITGCVDIAHGDEMSLKSAVMRVGPISVAIDAGHSSFQLYKSGVYTSMECSSTKLDHGVLAVGYGTEMGKDYWLVKNSWGEMWGMDGYIMMARNSNNMCGIATQASYPTV
uniref:procathepsin L-like n=2 Tax=Styela clava TaxID=7725 RepID=UPI00193AA072|nr:procathepsin L-like [Styela clava]